MKYIVDIVYGFKFFFLLMMNKNYFNCLLIIDWVNLMKIVWLIGGGYFNN